MRYRALAFFIGCHGCPGCAHTPGTLPLLEAFCGLTVSQRNTIRALQRIEREANDFRRDEWERTLKQLGEVSGRIATLTTRMRLTPQSRYGARSADTAARSVGDFEKPWEHFK